MISGNDQRKHDEADNRAFAGHPVAGDRLCCENAEGRRGDRHNGPHADTVPKRVPHRIAGEQFLVPLQGQAAERKLHVKRVVETEQRQEQHGKIERDQKNQCIELKRPVRPSNVGFAHEIRLRTNNVSRMKRALIAAMHSIRMIDNVAPMGQLLIGPNCFWMSTPIIDPSGPPSRVGVM